MVEFAVILAPLVALLIAIMQVSLTYLAQQSIETTSEQSVRLLLTGSAQAGGMSQAQFKAAVCGNLPSFLSCSKVMVDVRSAATFSAVNAGTPALTFDAAGNVTNTWAFQPGTPGQITVARIMYAWSVNSGPLGFDLSTMSGSRHLLIATSVFKTEPYTS